MAQTGRRDRRGRHDVAAEPGCAAPAPGPAQRAVASPDQRVPRFRDVRARVPTAHSVRGPGACRSHGRCRADRRHRRRDGGHATRTADQGGGPVAATRLGSPASPSRRIQWRAALVSGAVAGLAGAAQVLGVQHQLTGSIAVGYGYTGVVVATLGALSAIGVLLVAPVARRRSASERRTPRSCCRSRRRWASSSPPSCCSPWCRASRCGTTASSRPTHHHRRGR